MPKTDPATIIKYLESQGHKVWLGGELHIEPAVKPEQWERIKRDQQAIEDYLYDQLPLCTAHNFTTMEEFRENLELIRTHGVCLVCGIPWTLHGEPVKHCWQFVYQLSEVKTIRAKPVKGVSLAR